jgi:hypothetical protein
LGWTQPKNLMGNHSFAGVVDMKGGPDGALYVVNYAGFFASTAETRIERVFYKGPACEADIAWEKGGCKASDPTVTLDIPEACAGTAIQAPRGRPDPVARRLAINLGSLDRIPVPAGTHTVSAYALDGRQAFSAAILEGARYFEAPSGLQRGLYQIVLTP